MLTMKFGLNAAFSRRVHVVTDVSDQSHSRLQTPKQERLVYEGQRVHSISEMKSIDALLLEDSTMSLRSQGSELLSKLS